MKQQKIERFTRLVVVYMPFILINTLIVFIYLIYVINYLMLFIHKAERPPIHLYSFSYPHIILRGYIIDTLMPHKVKEFSVSVLIVLTWNTFWLIVSYHRTCFADPGYLLNPVDFEIKLVYSLINEIKTGDQSTCEVIAQENRERIKKRSCFIESFPSFTENGPLNQYEGMQFKRRMNHYLTSKDINRNTALEDSSFINNKALSNQPQSNAIKDQTTHSDQDGIPLSDSIDVYKSIDITTLILCPNCIRWKPERCHHCKHCNKCVLKMDHHCPWIANCIGFKNYKFFTLTILYGLITSLIVFASFWEAVLHLLLSSDESLTKCVICTFAYISNIILLAFLSFLFISNIRNVFFNVTTIEKADQSRFAYASSVLLSKSKVKYDQGVLNNLVTVFGSNPLLWLFPFSPNLKGEGIKFAM